QLGQHGVDLVLAAGPQAHQLGPVPGELPQLPDLRRGDPRLRQPAPPQPIRQVRGVLLVVFDSPVGERLHPPKVRPVPLPAPPRPPRPACPPPSTTHTWLRGPPAGTCPPGRSPGAAPPACW